MDPKQFDRLARSLGGAISRRGTLAALFGAGLAGAVGGAGAKKKRRRGEAGGKKGRGAAAVAAEAACASPGPSSNMSGCNFNGADFSGDDLSGSRMVGTRFNGATLVGTDLSSSNMKDATFRGADLTCANLRSSTLKNADFRGPAGPGGTNLTGADLGSSGCGGIRIDNKSVFCRTRLCDGSISDEDCPGGFDPDDFCCADVDCPGGQTCVDNQCETCGPFNCPNGCCDEQGVCRVDNAFACGTGGGACGPACADNQACVGGACVGCATACGDTNCPRCRRLVDGTTICAGGGGNLLCSHQNCTLSTSCPFNGVCTISDTNKATNAVVYPATVVCGAPQGTPICITVTAC